MLTFKKGNRRFLFGKGDKGAHFVKKAIKGAHFERVTDIFFLERVTRVLTL